MASNRTLVYKREQRGVYHITSKTVRGMYLFGKDPLTGKDYSHRREIVIERITYLARFFYIDLITFAVLINHVHLMLRNLPLIASQASDFDIIFRAVHIFPEKFRRLGLKLADVQAGRADDRIREMCEDTELVDEMRIRLSDISWFMRQLNQNLARRFNAEDGLKGAFWASRFHCRPVKGTYEMFVCCFYVDLNQVRAGEEPSPEKSSASAIYWRIAGLQARRSDDGDAKSNQGMPIDAVLIPINIHGDGEDRFEDYWRASKQGLFENMNLESYLILLDQVGRQIRDDKASIPAHLQPILERIGVQPEKIRQLHDRFESIDNEIRISDRSPARQKDAKPEK